MELEELPKEIPMANLSAEPLVSELILTGEGVQGRQGNRRNREEDWGKEDQVSRAAASRSAALRFAPMEKNFGWFAIGGHMWLVLIDRGCGGAAATVHVLFIILVLLSILSYPF